MYTTISKEAEEAIARIIWDILDEWFGDTIVFDPIVVIPEVDDYGREYLDVYIAYDGQREMLDAKWDVELHLLVMPDVAELGIQTTPSFSFIPRTDWVDENWGEFLRGRSR